MLSLIFLTLAMPFSATPGSAAASAVGTSFSVAIPAVHAGAPLDGRLIVLLSRDLSR